MLVSYGWLFNITTNIQQIINMFDCWLMFIGSFNPCLLMFIDVYYSSLVLTNLYWLLMCIIMFMMGISTAGFMPTLPWGLKHWKPSFSNRRIAASLGQGPNQHHAVVELGKGLQDIVILRLFLPKSPDSRPLQRARDPEFVTDLYICRTWKNQSTHSDRLISSCVILYHRISS